MVTDIIQRLKKAYPDARCSLNFNSPLQALLAIMLSAQCRDERVNQVTPALFARFEGADALEKASQEEVEGYVKTLGLYRNKAKNMRLLGTALVQHFDGQVPDDLEALLSLPGVGRKTALCVLQEVFGKVDGVVVDTHVARLARRLGWSDRKQPLEIERDLARLIPQKDWAAVNHLLIAHGRAVCTAGRPKCRQCPLQDLCPAAEGSEGSTSVRENHCDECKDMQE